MRKMPRYIVWLYIALGFLCVAGTVLSIILIGENDSPAIICATIATMLIFAVTAWVFTAQLRYQYLHNLNESIPSLRFIVKSGNLYHNDIPYPIIKEEDGSYRYLIEQREVGPGNIQRRITRELVELRQDNNIYVEIWGWFENITNNTSKAKLGIVTSLYNQETDSYSNFLLRGDRAQGGLNLSKVVDMNPHSIYGTHFKFPNQFQCDPHTNMVDLLERNETCYGKNNYTLVFSFISYSDTPLNTYQIWNRSPLKSISYFYFDFKRLDVQPLNFKPDRLDLTEYNGISSLN